MNIINLNSIKNFLWNHQAPQRTSFCSQGLETLRSLAERIVWVAKIFFYSFPLLLGISGIASAGSFFILGSFSLPLFSSAFLTLSLAYTIFQKIFVGKKEDNSSCAATKSSKPAQEDCFIKAFKHCSFLKLGAAAMLWTMFMRNTIVKNQQTGNDLIINSSVALTIIILGTVNFLALTLIHKYCAKDSWKKTLAFSACKLSFLAAFLNKPLQIGVFVGSIQAASAIISLAQSIPPLAKTALSKYVDEKSWFSHKWL